MYLYEFFGHAAFIPIFWLLGARVVFFYNLLAIGMDALCLTLNTRGRRGIGFAISVTTVSIHTILCTVAFGWASGFHYYILCLAVFVFMAPWGKVVNIFCVGVLIAAYVGLHVYLQSAMPLYPLSPRFLEGANIINIVVNFITLSFLSHYIIVAVGKAEEDLKKSKETLKTILAASPVGISHVVNREIIWANDVLSRITGYEPHELIGSNVSLFSRNLSSMGDIDQRLYKNGANAGIDIPSTKLVRKDGSLLDCMVQIRPVASDHRDQGAVIVVMDISQLTAAEKTRQELENRVQRGKKMEAIGLLAGGVAHDLNNVLSGIVSYPELILLDLPPQSPLAGPINTIRKSGEKASAIVQDLLSLARRGVTTKAVVNLNRIVEEYLKSPEFEKSVSFHDGVRIETDLGGKLMNTSAVPVHLANVVMNLVTNALEAMPDGGQMRITTENRYLDTPLNGYDQVAEGDYAVLSVKDTGIGMPAEDLDRIFEPFYTKKVMGRSGTGLGLAVIWSTVKDCGGYIDVTSDPEAGSTFTLYFPVTRTPLAQQASAVDIQRLLGKGKRVLVVDDVAEQREIASGMLNRLGYTVFCVPSGEAAVDFVAETAVDLVLLDMIMDPGLDGLETYRRILDLCPGQQAVIASGYSETERVREAQRLGAGQYLKKPYTLGELAVVVHETLGKTLSSGA
ncbi:MAG: response regulator [Desulfobacterales bacterium]|nr:response regulator [Desulfobacterales bacterium]